MYIKNHFSVVLKFIQSDNGRKFLSHEWKRIFSENEIVYQRTTTYSPQQNGIVERKQRHLLDTIRAVRIHANLPKDF